MSDTNAAVPDIAIHKMKDCLTMSDTTIVPDFAIDALRERMRQLDNQIKERTRLNDIDIAIHNELAELVAALTRKSKPRKPRVSGSCAGTPAADAMEEPTPGPTVFASAATSDTNHTAATFSPRASAFVAPDNAAGDMAEAA